MKDPMTLAQCISQCKFLKKISHFYKKSISSGTKRYVAHVTRLENHSFQKQLSFSNDHKKYARDHWLKIEKELNVSKIQIQRLMQNKKVFTSLLNKYYGYRQFKWYKVPNKYYA